MPPKLAPTCTTSMVSSMSGNFTEAGGSFLTASAKASSNESLFE